MGSTAAAVASAKEQTNHTSSPKSLPWWSLFFFFSGFPALIYQIVWERCLFSLYGVNIESVTMIVTAFLLGLGLGSLIGGEVSKHQTWPLLRLFGLAELMIGAYGVESLKIFHGAAKFTAGSSALETAIVVFALVVLPTVLMGATLPILVSHTARGDGCMGNSVGALYAVNTLGSAVACFCAGWFLMRCLGQSRSVLLAAGLNALIGSSVLIWDGLAQKMLANKPAATDDLPIQIAVQTNTSRTAISLPAAVLTAALAGFVSLGYEIVWYRLFSFTTAGRAQSFAFLLGAYLAGLAVGSFIAATLARTVANRRRLMRFLITCIFAASLLAFLVGPILFYLVVHVSYLWTLIVIGLAAACLGAVFPTVCEAAIFANQKVGLRVGFVYLANIAGSALGSYVTGFILMDIFPLRQVTVILALLGLSLGLILSLKAQLRPAQFFAVATAVLVGVMFIVFGSKPLFDHMYEKMLMKQRYISGSRFAAVVETRSGVVTVTPTGTVFGGGIYDGRFNVSLVDDSNGIERAFALSYFCPSPKNVLMIGLSSGSWAQVIANHPQVEHLTVVEIDPGYLPLIAQVSPVAGLFTNPKVHIEIDDGRRWLMRNPDRKYDAIIMNTTYYWRQNASNILSSDFLEIIRHHLNPGGIHFYNTTGSDRVLATGVSVFPYGLRVANFLVVSDSPLQIDAQRWVHVLLNYKIDGKPVFDLSQRQHQRRLAEVISIIRTLDQPDAGFFTLESASHIRARTQNARMITDDNMGAEW